MLSSFMSLPWAELSTHRLHNEIIAYAAYITPTAQERLARERVIARVGDVVKRRFPDATVTAFGSVAHDLYFPDRYARNIPIYASAIKRGAYSDIDLVVRVPRELDHGQKKRMLFQLSGALQDSLITDKVLVVHQARVPIVSFEAVADLGELRGSRPPIARL